MSAKEKCEDKKDESEECKETDGIQYSDNDINNFINKAMRYFEQLVCEDKLLEFYIYIRKWVIKKG